MTLGILFFATAVAGFAYAPIARTLQVISTNTPRLIELITFWLLLLTMVIVLEIILRRTFPDVDLPQLGVLDRILALLPGILCGLILVSLLFTSLGYGAAGSWGPSLAEMRAFVANGYHTAALGPAMQQILYLHLLLHRLWFPTPPPLLAYGLP
jgi:hypothetical protein